MTFTSISFLLFFPVIILLFNIIPYRYRVCFLLIVSYLFYALMQPVYLLLLVFVTIITYYFAIAIDQAKDDGKRHSLLVGGITLVLIPLFFFKYFNSINIALTELFKFTGLNISLTSMKFLLPIGISFYTFMAIGYLVD